MVGNGLMPMPGPPPQQPPADPPAPMRIRVAIKVIETLEDAINPVTNFDGVGRPGRSLFPTEKSLLAAAHENLRTYINGENSMEDVGLELGEESGVPSIPTLEDMLWGKII